MADLTDLTQNVSIHNEATDAAVTTTTDGAKERLDVHIQEPLEVSGLGDTALEDGILFSTTTDEISTAVTGSVALVMIKNPSATKNVMVQDVIISSRGAANNTFRYYKNPSITANGTALTTTNLNFTSSTIAIATPFKFPTASANGTLIYGTTSTDDKHTVARSFFDETNVILGQNDILMIVASSLKNILFWVNIKWSEVGA